MHVLTVLLFVEFIMFLRAPVARAAAVLFYLVESDGRLRYGLLPGLLLAAGGLRVVQLQVDDLAVVHLMVASAVAEVVMVVG